MKNEKQNDIYDITENKSYYNENLTNQINDNINMTSIILQLQKNDLKSDNPEKKLGLNLSENKNKVIKKEN